MNDRMQNPSGLDAVIHQRFHESADPTIGRAQAVEKILAELQRHDIAWERIKLSDQPVRRGALIDASGQRVQVPEGKAFDRCYVALVDPNAMAQWAHPAYWAFVPADGEATQGVVLTPTDLPEHLNGPVHLLVVEPS